MKFFDKSLDSYGFSDETVSVIKPIIHLIEHNDVASAEKAIAELAIAVCDKIRHGSINPAIADKYFSLMDLFLGDNHKDILLREEVIELIGEGMLLHDLGKDCGADLDKLVTLAKTIVNQV